VKCLLVGVVAKVFMDITFAHPSSVLEDLHLNAVLRAVGGNEKGCSKHASFH